ADAFARGDHARSAPDAVVLQAAAHRVRILVVDLHAIELRARKRVDDLPRLAAVIRNLEAAVRSFEDSPRVSRIDPHRLMVAVHAIARVAERASGILGEL